MLKFEGRKVILLHGVVDLRKGAVGILALVPEVEENAWYMCSNRSRQLVKMVMRDKAGLWLAVRRLDRGQFSWLEMACGSSVIEPKDAEAICNGGAVNSSWKDEYNR